MFFRGKFATPGRRGFLLPREPEHRFPSKVMHVFRDNDVSSTDPFKSVRPPRGGMNCSVLALRCWSRCRCGYWHPVWLNPRGSRQPLAGFSMPRLQVPLSRCEGGLKLLSNKAWRAIEWPVCSARHALVSIIAEVGLGNVAAPKSTRITNSNFFRGVDRRKRTYSPSDGEPSA